MTLPAITLALCLRAGSAPLTGQIALKPGFYTFDALAASLSREGITVTAAKALRGRVVYLALDPLDAGQLPEILKAASGVTLYRVGDSGKSFRLAPNEEILRREAAARNALVDHLRGEVERVRGEAEALWLGGEDPRVAIPKAGEVIRAIKIPAAGSAADPLARARAVDARAEAETGLWAALTLDDLANTRSRVAMIPAFQALPSVTGASYGRRPVTTFLPTGAAIAFARRAGIGEAEIATYAKSDGFVVCWALRRETGRLSLSADALWVSDHDSPSFASFATSAFLPSGAHEDAGLGLVEALYVGVPGSKRCGAVLPSPSRDRYTALETNTRAWIATEEGRSLVTAFAKAPPARTAGTLSRRLESWGQETGHDVAFELDPLGDLPDRFHEPAAIPSFSAWRFSKVGGVTVANQLLDFVDRAIPMDTAALMPFIAKEPGARRDLTEEEARTYFKAVGPTADLPDPMPFEYLCVRDDLLRSGGAAFLAYETLRKRPELASLLAGRSLPGKPPTGARQFIEIPLSTVGESTTQALANALPSHPLDTVRLYEDATQVWRRSAVRFTVDSVLGNGLQRLQVEFRPGPDATGRRRYISGLTSSITFLRKPG